MQQAAQPVRWRWDQGRLAYFQFDNIRAIAQVLVPLDGVRLDAGDPLRGPLQPTGLPFAPIKKGYAIWRNYARVFGAACLAARVNDRLRVTGICRALAAAGASQLSVDDYFTFLVPRLYFPWPAFQGYSHTARVVYPFCTILRYLMTHRRPDGFGAVALGEVFSRIIGNDCRGDEPLDFYRNLQDTARRPVGDEKRQIREFLIFFSQLSFLKWATPNTLYLDVDALDATVLHRLERLATPMVQRRLADAHAEILAVGSFDPHRAVPISVPAREVPEDLVFTEGRKVRANHLRIERSPKLRAMLLAKLGANPRCDICRRDMRRHYPWTTYRTMLEVHHLLPLGSAVIVDRRGTSLSDVTGLCRSCHGAVHFYYREWLDHRELADFRSKNEATAVYEECKHGYVA